MARSTQQLLVCVVACLAVTSLALESCPEKSSFNGCRRRGCISVPSRRDMALVCDECGEGYRLVNKGSTRAKCECAAGYAGKGNDGICKKCPAGTQVAEGGSVISSECLRCPQGTIASRDGTRCTCAAGHYQVAVSRADPGFMPVGCKLCSGRTQYITGSLHTSRSCSTCRSGQVANKAHTWCVDPRDADAVPEPTIPGLDVTLSDIQDALRGARERVDEARIAAMDDVGSSAGPSLLRGPGARLSDGIAALVAGGDSAEGVVPAAPKLPSLQELAKTLNLTDIAARAANVTSLADLAKQLNISSLNPAELAKLNITSVGELLRNLNTSAVLPPVDVAATIGKVGERIMSMLPRLPDPLYLAGLRLDPQALADADLPAASNVPQLFGSLMSRTLGDLDDSSDWTDLLGPRRNNDLVDDGSGY
ncbi:hypothetical protein COO60DRAFT_1533329 [Scenedesmus sp. NREL 46B-D3]|nr:hypothetical protein COO60DRAFT_1533329 [Scenedesmus sp. NREL 46B-D3]